MTLEEARRTLGLSADEDLSPRLAELEAARNRIAELVRMAPNDTIALRYQDGLIEFERALAVLREQVELDQEAKKRQEWMSAATGMKTDAPELPEGTPTLPKSEKGPASTPAAETPPALPPKAPVPPAAKTETLPDVPVRHLSPQELEPAITRRRGGIGRVVFVMLLLAGGAGWYLHQQTKERHHLQVMERVAFLEGLGAKMIDSRQWPEADAIYKQIEELAPGTNLKEALAAIESSPLVEYAEPNSEVTIQN